MSQTGLREEALQTLTRAQIARNKTIDTNERVSSVEAGLVGVASNVRETAVNVQKADEALMDAESKCKMFIVVVLINGWGLIVLSYSLNDFILAS